MKFVARYLLWILIAVLPMQGSAAAWLLHGNGKVPMTAEGGHCGQVAMAHHAAGKAATKAVEASDQAGNPHAKCSSCASCCAGASAPPLDLLPSLPHPQVNIAAGLPQPAMTGFIASTPERPPRALA